MSVGHRSIARLPLELFEHLGECHSSNTIDEGTRLSSQQLRSAIVAKLQHVPRKKRFRTTYDRVSSVGPFLRLSPNVLMRALDPILTYDECILLQKRIAQCCAPQPTSACQLLHGNIQDDTPVTTRYLRTGLDALDASINGGLRIGTLTELVGKAGTGKSQLAMQTAVLTAYGKQGTILVDTEAKISLPRLQEIATERCQQAVATVLKNVTIHESHSMSELDGIFTTLEEEIFLRNTDAAQFPVRLLVVDSIAAPARRDIVSNSQRAIVLIQCAQRLKRLADQFQLAVLMINQVGSTSERAALGTTWHHCVTTRIQLTQEPPDESQTIKVGAGTADRPLRRKASVVKSNAVAGGSTFFAIDRSGIVGVTNPLNKPIIK